MPISPAILLAWGCAGSAGPEAWESPEGTDWAQVAASAHNATCGLRGDGAAECWGYDADQGMTPPDVPLVRMDVGYSVCGVTKDAALVCGGGWGTAAGVTVNLSALADGAPYADVAVGGTFYCGLSEAGALRCISTGQTAVVVPTGEVYTGISAGLSTLCGLHDDGSATCWDTDGVRADHPGPFTRVEAGDEGACGLTEGGGIACWGATFVDADPGPFVALSIGGDAACALDGGGAMACWVRGGGVYGVNPPEDGPFTGVAAGTTQVCGLGADGAISCAETQSGRK